VPGPWGAARQEALVRAWLRPASAPAARSDRAAGGQSNNGSAAVMGAGAGLRRLWQTEALRIASGLEVAASMGLARGPTDRACGLAALLPRSPGAGAAKGQRRPAAAMRMIHWQIIILRYSTKFCGVLMLVKCKSPIPNPPSLPQRGLTQRGGDAQPGGLPAAHPGRGRGRAAAPPGRAARPGRAPARAALRLPVGAGRRAARPGAQL